MVSGRRSAALPCYTCPTYQASVESRSKTDAAPPFRLFISAIFGRPLRHLSALYFWGTKHRFQLFDCLSVLFPSSGEVSLQTRCAALQRKQLSLSNLYTDTARPVAMIRSAMYSRYLRHRRRSDNRILGARLPLRTLLFATGSPLFSPLDEVCSRLYRLFPCQKHRTKFLHLHSAAAKRSRGSAGQASASLSLPFKKHAPLSTHLSPRCLVYVIETLE